jgi:hypothetical protein
VIGDARLSLERAPSGSVDLLVLDAFSSDSVPMHLLTAEAFGLYRRILTPNGLLLVHISNRFLDLEPVVAAAASAGWDARLRDFWPAPAEVEANATNSVWIAMSPSPASIAALEQASPPRGWRPLRRRPDFAPWSDDYGSILPIVRNPLE